MPFLRNSNNLWSINRSAEDGNTDKSIPVPFCDYNIIKGEFMHKTLMLDFILSHAIAYAYREKKCAVNFHMAG